MSTFDEQTDFSFLGISVDEPKKIASSKKNWGNESVGIGLTHSRSHSDEARAKMSAALKGKKRGPRSEETKAKIGAANSVKLKGRTYTPEPQRGLKISLGKARPVVTPLGRFRMVQEAAKAHDVNVVTIYRYILKYPEHYYYIEEAK